MTIGEVVQILQQWHQYQRDETWSRRDYDLGLQSMRIDILNTVREEMRDQVTVIISSLDNLMVVATLMLSIGFGFAVEGTFPPAESDYDYDDFQKCLLVLYAFLSALSLVFPLACLMLTIAARFEVELCQQDVMGDLQKHLLKALQKDQTEDPPQLMRNQTNLSQASGARPRNGQQDPLEAAENAEDRTPSSPRQNRVRNLGDQIKGALGTLVTQDRVGHIAEREVQLIAEGLLERVNYYHTLYPIAQLFLWLGMLSSVLVCSVLLGLYFAANFPETQWMWRMYSGILGTCAILSGAFYFWMKFRMLKEPLFRTRIQRNAMSSTDVSAVRRDSAPLLSSNGVSNDGCIHTGFGAAQHCGRNASSLWQSLRPRWCGHPSDYMSAGSDTDLCFESAIEEDDADRPPLRQRRTGEPPTESTVPQPNFSANNNSL